jgi:hypothetical protein
MGSNAFAAGFLLILHRSVIYLKVKNHHFDSLYSANDTSQFCSAEHRRFVHGFILKAQKVVMISSPMDWAASEMIDPFTQTARAFPFGIICGDSARTQYAGKVLN